MYYVALPHPLFMRTSIQKSQLIRIIKAIKIDIEHAYDMKRSREEPVSITKTKKQSVDTIKRSNEKHRIGSLAHAMAIGVTERTPDRLALTGDISEYEARHEIHKSHWAFITDKTNSTILYPTDVKKYSGTVYPRGNRWRTTIYAIDDSATKRSRTFATREEAVDFVKKTSIEAGVVKNVVYIHGDDYYCELAHHQHHQVLMKFSKESLPLVEEHNMFAQYNDGVKSYYAIAYLNGVGVNFHAILCKANPGETVDHINRDTLDNTLPNLRSADAAVQNSNRDLTPSATGVRGVTEKKGDDGETVGYVARWTENDADPSKTFPISKYGKEEALRLAIELRKEKERTIPLYVKAFGKK